MEDPFIFAESLDERTLEYVAAENRRFNAAFSEGSAHIRKGVSDCFSMKRVNSVKVKGGRTILCSSKDGMYSVELDGKTLYETPNIISWFEPDSEGSRIAVFESGGSDRGTLSILSEGKTIEELEGTFSGAMFTPASYLLVKTFTESPPEPDAELNTHRVIQNGEVVFGQGLGPSDFISLHGEGERVTAIVGDWKHSKIYDGPVSSPKEWKVVREEEYSVDYVGFNEGDLFLIERKGNGVITKNSSEFISPGNPIESAYLVENGIMTITMDNARSTVSLHGWDGKLVRKYLEEIPVGFKAGDSDGLSAVMAFESFGISSAVFAYTGYEMSKLEESVADNYKIEDRWVNSGGTRIHYFFVESGSDNQRTLVYGYGAFNIPLVPAYRAMFAYLLR